MQPSAAHSCRIHPKAAATWHCETCQEFFCDLCVNVRRVGDSVRHLCRKCGHDVTPVAIQYVEPVQENFFTELPGAFRYPCQGDGLILIGSAVVCFSVLQLMAFAPLIGRVIASIMGLLATGYLCSYLKEIIYTTGNGRNTLPDWPDLGNWTDDILPPAAQFILVILLILGPPFVMERLHPFDSDSVNSAFALGWLLLSGILAPMGLLMIVMFDSIGALNPFTIVLAIARAPGPYFTAALLVDFVLSAYAVLSYLAHLAHLPWFLSALVMGFVELYALAVAMRILGLLYRTEKDRLGWA
jgi:hypothetical protein